MSDPMIYTFSVEQTSPPMGGGANWGTGRFKQAPFVRLADYRALLAERDGLRERLAEAVKTLEALRDSQWSFDTGEASDADAFLAAEEEK